MKGAEFRVHGRLPSPVLKELIQLSPWRSAWSLAQTWGLVALFVGAASSWRHPVVVAVCLIGIAGQQHALAILTHQAAHYRLFRSRRLNDAAGALCGYPLGVSMITYRVIHRLHHNNLYKPIDPDLALMAGYPRGRAYLIRKLLKDLSGGTALKNYAYFFGRSQKGNGGARTLDDTSPKLKAAARRDRRQLVVVQVLAISALVFAGFGWPLLLLWLLPLLTLTQALLRLRAVCEHGAVPDPSVTRLACRTTLAPAWVRWLVFPHNMHYHIEHHLYPAVPHYRLPDCHRAMREHGLLEGTEVVDDFGETLRRIFAPRVTA